MARSPRQEGFSTRHRFSARGSFGPVLRSPRKLRGDLAVVHVAKGPATQSRLGIALTRRMIARSVDRNRVKRLVREVFRRHEAKNAGLDCVVTLRTSFDGSAAQPLAHELRSLFDQLTPR